MIYSTIHESESNHLPGRNELHGAVENDRYLWAEGNGKKKLTVT